jgi:hypothetical protein
MIQELLTEGPPISRTDAAFCNSDPRQTRPKALSNVIKAVSHPALLYELELPFLFLLLLHQKQNFFFPKAAEDAEKSFGHKFGDQEICPDIRPYAQLNVNHVRDYLFTDLVQQINLYKRTRKLMLGPFILSIFAFKHDTS